MTNQTDQTVAQLSEELTAAQARNAELTAALAECTREAERFKLMVESSTAEYRLLVETLPDTIIRTDLEGTIQFTSRGMGPLEPAQLIGMNVVNFALPERRGDVQTLLKKNRAGETAYYETELSGPEGQKIWHADRGIPIVQNGQVTGAIVIHSDITDRKQVEEALRASEETARALLNAPTDTVLMVDTGWNVLAINEAAARAFGKAPDELVGQCILNFFPPETAKARQAAFEKIVHSGKPVRYEDERAGRYFDDSVYPILDANGQVAKFAIFARDITERKQAEAEQARLQQQVIEAQRHALQELSTPIIPVMERIIVMPLIGSIDTLRAKDITRTLLAGISRHRAKIVIVDITGVPLVDSGVADHLNKTIQAARLKGAEAIVTGMSDAVAETIVDLGIDWSGVQTLGDLQTGLLSALDSLGIKLTR